MADFMGLMKQAQTMQAKMQELQEELARLEIEGQSGAGMVKARMNGKGEVIGVRIDPSLAKPEEVEVLEDLILAALKDAKGKVEAEAQGRMKGLMGGLSLPPGLKLF